jgi:hypothetical protein
MNGTQKETPPGRRVQTGSHEIGKTVTSLPLTPEGINSFSDLRPFLQLTAQLDRLERITEQLSRSVNQTFAMFKLQQGACPYLHEKGLDFLRKNLQEQLQVEAAYRETPPWFWMPAETGLGAGLRKRAAQLKAIRASLDAASVLLWRWAVDYADTPDWNEQAAREILKEALTCAYGGGK